jgi:hypothetical protein
MAMRQVCVVRVFRDYLKEMSTESNNGDRQGDQEKYAVKDDPQTDGKPQQQRHRRSIKNLEPFHNAASFVNRLLLRSRCDNRRLALTAQKIAEAGCRSRIRIKSDA